MTDETWMVVRPAAIPYGDYDEHAGVQVGNRAAECADLGISFPIRKKVLSAVLPRR